LLLGYLQFGQCLNILNIHEILENVCYWQEISIYSILVGFILTFKYLLNYYNGMVLPTKFNMTSKVRLP
jgi:hypothetical protein